VESFGMAINVSHVIILNILITEPCNVWVVQHNKYLTLHKINVTTVHQQSPTSTALVV
jgi:hypothetical protein